MTYRDAMAVVLAVAVVSSGVVTAGVVGPSLRSGANRSGSADGALPAPGGNSTEYETFSGTFVVETDTVYENSTFVVRIWANRSSGAYRIESLDPENTTWEVVVSNGSRVWAYDGEQNLVVTTDDVHGRFAESATGWVRPFFYDDFFYSSADLAERLDLYQVRSLGRQTVAGRETFVLRLGRTALAPVIAPETMTLWLDANWSVPVRMETVSRSGAGDSSRTRSYRNLSFGPVDPARFTFDPPATANVTRPEALRPSFVPEPRLPPDFQLAGRGMTGAATYENGTKKYYRRTLTARYENLTTTLVVENHTRPHPRENFTVGEGVETIRANLDDQYPFPANGPVTGVTVGGVTGATWTANGSAYAAWPCGESYYLVHAPLPASAVVEVARTVACGDGTASTATALGERASTPEADRPPANATRIAPGVTTAGIENPARLLAAHHDAVADGDFAAVVNETRTVRRGNETATLRLDQRFRYDAASGTYLASYRNRSAPNRGPTVVWGNGTTAVARTTVSGHAVYEPPAAPSSSVPTGSSYLLSLFRTYDFAVRETTPLADSNRTRLLLEDDTSGVEASLVLDREGRIYSFGLSAAADSSSLVRRAEYRLLPERDVPELRPPWVADAPRDATFRVQMGMEVEPNYVYLSHRRGETVPAGTVVALTTGGETYATRLREPLRPGEDRQLYVRNGSLTVTADHPEAKHLGENLSSPVNVLVYTERGVPVFHERFRWHEDDVLSLGRRSDRLPAVPYSRS